MISSDSDSTPLEGSRIGPYVLEEKLGQGAMGAVFRARDTESGAEHAVKLLLTAQTLNLNNRNLSRFQRELEVLAQLPPHRGLVRIHRSGIAGGIPWFAMELVLGPSLHDWLAKGPLATRKAVELVAQIARTVEQVHAVGVIHRDLKPGNVIIDEQGEPRLVDFGLAFDESSEAISRTGEFLGTPAFMAPEQVSRPAHGDPQVDFGPTTDVYALGGILFNCLTGRRPFSDHHGPSLFLAVLKTPPPSPQRLNPSLPGDLAAICLKALQKQPAGRYPTALDLAEDLERWLKDERVLATRDSSSAWVRLLDRRPRGKGSWLAGLALCGALAVTALAITSKPPSQAPSLQQRLDALQSKIQEAGLGTASPEALSILEQEAVAAGQSALAARTALLAGLVTLAREDSEAALDRVAALVRPGGGLDQRRLRLAEKLLAASKRWGAVNQILHAHEPTALAHPDLATDLARALAAGGPWLHPPRDQRSFEALYEAPRLDDPTRGALLLRRAAHWVSQGPEGFAEALADLEQAFVSHGATDTSLELPTGFLGRSLEELLTRVEADDPRAKTLSNLLCRLDHSQADLTSEQVARVQGASLPANVMMRDTTSLLDVEPVRFQVLAPVLEQLGRWPIRTDKLRTPEPRLVPRWLQRLTEKELSRPPGKQHPALIMVLAQILIKRDPERAHQLVAAAAKAGAHGHWYHLLAGHTLRELGSPGLALQHLDRGLELDRLRAPHQRWPLAAELMARHRLSGAADPEALFAIARLTLEARETQRSVSPLLESLRASGASVPWVLERSTNIAGLTTLVVTAMLKLTTTSCCPDDGPTPQQLIDEALDLLDQPFAAAVMDIDGEVQGTSDTLLLELRSLHHRKHQRPELALVDLGRALERERGHRPSLVNIESRWLKRQAGLLRSRAALLRKLGREEAARADEAEARRLAKESRKAR